MRAIATLLLKVLVKQFYIVNAGFLLFIFFVFFGMVNSAQLISYHKSLILSMISSPIVMALVWVAWLLYNIKCMLFCNDTIKAADSNYLFILRMVPPGKQFIIYLLVSALQYMPMLAYSFFVVCMAVSRSMLLTATAVSAYQFLMVALSARVIFVAFNKSTHVPLLEKLSALMGVRNKIKMGYYSFLTLDIFHERKIAFAIVKIFSILLLSVSFVKNGDNFDDDLFSIFFQLILTAHAILVFYCVNFNETKMYFSRNLPLPLYKVGGMYIFTYALILLPELGFMLVNNHGNLPGSLVILFYCTAVSTLFLYTAILYGCEMDMENYMLFVFVLFVMIFFLQKTGLQFLTMMTILIAAGVSFKTTYYHFERK